MRDSADQSPKSPYVVRNSGTITAMAIRTTCRTCGHGGCGVFVQVEKGDVVRFEADRDHPISRGYFCSKGLASAEIARHPDRLSHPLRRVGPRGAGRFERISWDEALDEIAERLRGFKEETGAESVAFAHGTGRDYAHFLYRVANLFGTPNVLNPGHMCYIPRVTISRLLGLPGLPICDYENRPRCNLVWGSNHLKSNPDEYKAVQLARNLKGSKLIVVDPRRTALAERADLWLQLRPATDTALALGMINHLIERDLYDREFVERHTYGFDELAARAAEYDLDRVEELTWVPAEQVAAAAELFATTKPACIQWGVGLEQNVNCIDADRSLIYLLALTGNLDAPGGNVIFEPAPVVPYMTFRLGDRLPPEQRAKMLGGDKYRVGLAAVRCTPPEIYHAILTGQPYPVRALLVFGTNPLSAHENATMIREALERLEFLVVADLFMTPSARLADLVLPVAFWLEHDGIGDYWKEHGFVFPRNKVLEPPGEARPDHLILNELGKRLGYGEFFFDSLEGALDFMLEPSGLTWREFRDRPYLQGRVGRYRKYETDGFATETGRLELASRALERLGYDPLPEFVEPPESPANSELAARYPYVLITGARIFEFFNSEHRNVPSLRRRHPDPLAELNPRTAAEHGIADGDWISIETPRGRIRQRARLTDGIDPRVVHVEHGWWFPEREDGGWAESNANILTDDAGPLDPRMGSTNLKGLLCRIARESSDQPTRQDSDGEHGRLAGTE
jgi:anaerobic selenocysteine-containing dehydrogenase